MNTTTTENHNLCAKHDHGTKEIAHWYINGEKIIFLFAIPFLLRFSAFFFLGATFRFGAAVFITLCFRCPFTQMLNDLFCWSASIVVGAYRMCRPYKMYLCVLLINETRWLDANDSTTISAYSSFVVFITTASFSSNNWPIIVLPFSVLLYFNRTDFFLLLSRWGRQRPIHIPATEWFTSEMQKQWTGLDI